MEYVKQDEHGYDLLFVGSFCGGVHAFLFAKRKVPRTLRPEDISRDMKHAGEVTCLVHRYGAEEADWLMMKTAPLPAACACRLTLSMSVLQLQRQAVHGRALRSAV
jgi:hypothetical protein